MSTEVARAKVLAEAFRHPELRALALIFTCFKIAEMGAWIAVTTVAHQNGGIDEASRVVFAQLAPAALVALGVGALARRLGLRLVLAGGLFVQSAALVGIAVLLRTGAPILLVYGLAVLGAVAVVTTRPTVASVMPMVVDGPHELTAANSIVGWLDSVAVMLGPVITAVGFAWFGLSAPFVVFGTLTLLAAVVAARIAPNHRPGTRVTNAEVIAAEASPTTRPHSVRSIMVVLASHAFLIGALDLLFVVVAIDVTGGPPARAGWLNTAFGVGAVIGGTATALLIGRPRLWPVVLGAGLGAATTVALVGASTGAGLNAVAFAGCGLCAAVLFVSSRTLLQRCCDLDSLCRAFSIAEAAEMALLLVGALTIPVLVDALGSAHAAIGVGALVAIAVAFAIPRIVGVERDAQVPLERVKQLRTAELFASLPAPTLETLAREAEVVTVLPGTPIITQGDVGDRFYVVTGGEVVVDKDGIEVGRVGPGGGFGELALLYDAPRNATVTAFSRTSLLAVDRAPFLVAMTGQPLSAALLSRTAPSSSEGP